MIPGFADLGAVIPDWASLALAGVLIVWMMTLGSFVLARLGLSPLWVLLLLVPGANVVGIWLFAYGRWPRMARAAAAPDAGEPDRR